MAASERAFRAEAVGLVVAIASLFVGVGAWLSPRSPTEQPLPRLLDDLQAWIEASPAQQDEEIEAVQRRLGPRFRPIETAVFRCFSSSYRLARFVHEGTGIELVLVPGSESWVGTEQFEAEAAHCQVLDPSWRSKRVGWEVPRRRVKRSPLLVGRFEVTQAQWLALIKENPSSYLSRGDAFPVNGVSYEDCLKFLKLAGDGLRLPREEEWEGLCRGGGESRFHWDDREDGGGYCWNSSNSQGRAHEVDEHRSRTNPFGLVDMSGNVAEWCLDEWQESGAPDARGVVAERAEAVFFAVRGGSYETSFAHCRSAARDWQAKDCRSPALGFRVVRDLK